MASTITTGGAFHVLTTEGLFLGGRVYAEGIYHVPDPWTAPTVGAKVPLTQFNNVNGIAVDAQTGTAIACVETDGVIYYSLDRGLTWDSFSRPAGVPWGAFWLNAVAVIVRE